MSESEEEFTMEDAEEKTSKTKKPKLKLKLSVKPDPAASSSSDAVKKKKKKAKEKEKEAKSSKKRKANASSASSDKKPGIKKAKVENGGAKDGKKKLKELDKSERLTYAMQSFLWWDAEDPPEGCQWRTMEHAGVSFPEPYVPHGVKMKYDGEAVDLTPAQEEA
jgi:DNA topoisomerase I